MKNGTYYIDEELNEFDNFFKGKKRRSCEDEAKAKGKTNRQARIQCRTELGGSAIGRGAKKVGLAIPRGAFLTLLRFNFRGMASRLYRAKSEQTTEWKRATRKWLSLGGNEDALLKGMSAGKDKKPLGCGANCKAKFDLKSNFIDYTDDEMIFLEENPDFSFSNLEPAVTSSLIATGGAVLGAMAGAISKTRMTKLEAEANKEGAEAQAGFLKKQQEEKSKRTKTLIIGASVLSVVIIGGLFILRKRRTNK